MSTPDPNAYLRTKVMTANPAELRLMLLDGALKFARQGRDGLLASDHEAAYNGFTQAQDIVMELINNLRPEYAPDLCEKLQALYLFIFNQLVDSCMQRDPAVADEAITLLDYERETWMLLMERIASDSERPTPLPPANPLTVADDETSATSAPGRLSVRG